MYTTPEWDLIDGNSCMYHFIPPLSILLPTPHKMLTICRIDCQSNLSTSLTALNPNTKLFVIREAPQTLLPKLFKAWNITHLVFEKDTDAYARQRDNEVVRLAREAGVQVVTRVGRTLYDPDVLVEKNGGRPTMSINQVMNVFYPSSYSMVFPFLPCFLHPRFGMLALGLLGRSYWTYFPGWLAGL